MINPTPEVLQALTNLRVSSDFETVVEWLRENRKTARDKLEDHVEDKYFLRFQGEARFLKEFLELNDTAPQRLDKIKP